MPYDPNLILWAFSDADLFTPREIGDEEVKHQVVGNFHQTQLEIVSFKGDHAMRLKEWKQIEGGLFSHTQVLQFFKNRLTGRYYSMIFCKVLQAIFKFSSILQ